MTRKIVTLLFLLLHSQVWGEKISKQDVLTDLAFLNEAVINGHLANYNANHTIHVQAVLEKVRSIRQDSLGFFEYQFLIGEALYQIGCVHTSIKKNTLKTSQPVSYFPLPLIIISNKLFVVEDTIYNLAGKEILAFNVVSADQIINTMQHYRGSDGGGNAFAQTYFQKASSALMALYFHYPANYQLLSGHEKIEVKAAKNFAASDPLKVNETIIYRNKENIFYQQKDAAVLRLLSFSKPDKAIFKSSMRYVNKKNITNLVIDLRGNTGGNRAAVISLAKFLMDTVFF